MKTFYSHRLLSLVAAALLIFGFAAAASAKGVKTEAVKPGEIQPGTYSVITAHNPSPVAILAKEGTPYEIKLVTSGSGYNVTGGLTEDQALNKANEVLKKDAAVAKTDIREIKAPDGSVIGYEMTPVYQPIRYGSVPDVTVTSYKVKGNQVFAYVTPDQMRAMQEAG